MSIGFKLFLIIGSAVIVAGLVFIAAFGIGSSVASAEVDSIDASTLYQVDSTWNKNNFVTLSTSNTYETCSVRVYIGTELPQDLTVGFYTATYMYWYGSNASLSGFILSTVNDGTAFTGHVRIVSDSYVGTATKVQTYDRGTGVWTTVNKTVWLYSESANLGLPQNPTAISTLKRWLIDASPSLSSPIHWYGSGTIDATDNTFTPELDRTYTFGWYRVGWDNGALFNPTSITVTTSISGVTRTREYFEWDSDGTYVVFMLIPNYLARDPANPFTANDTIQFTLNCDDTGAASSSLALPLHGVMDTAEAVDGLLMLRSAYLVGMEQAYQNASEYNLATMAFAILETPAKVLLGTWDNDPTSPTYQTYVGGLLNFEIFGYNLRYVFLSLVTVVIFLYIVHLFLGSGGGSDA